MPDKSKDQRVAMNMAKAIQAGDLKPKPGTASAEIAKSMKPSDLKDFGGPITGSGLPKKVHPAPAAPPAKPSGMKMVNTPTGSLQKVPGSKAFKGLAAPKGAKVPPAGNPQDKF